MNPNDAPPPRPSAPPPVSGGDAAAAPAPATVDDNQTRSIPAPVVRTPQTPVVGADQAYGKYQLIRKLAVGGMAEVFLARQRGIAGFEKLLVIKRILPEYTNDPEFVSMFLDEARLAASMSHPNVVQIYDLGQLDTTYFLAMEYVPGPDLLTIVRAHARANQRLPFHLSARIIASVADALAYAHDHKDARGRPLRLVHRDVTPSNILVAYGGNTKLVDFGIAKAESQSSKTAAGKVKGKTRYLAPEQLQQTGVTGRTDLWAAGVCLYELVTGVRPIAGDNELAMMKAILDLEIARPQSVAPDVPAALDAIIMKCLVRDPEQRMPSGEALRRELEAWLRTVEEPSSPADVGHYLQAFFKTEFEELELSLAELADRKSIDSSAVAKLPSMGLEVTPSGTTGVGKKKEATQARVEPKPVEPVVQGRSRLGLGLAAAAVLALGVAAVALTQKGAEGSLRVTTEPAGATVKVDGSPWPSPTPTQVKKLGMGAHEVELTLEGYEPQRTMVRLTDDDTAQAVAVVLTRAVAKATALVIEATPAPERLKVDGTAVVPTGVSTRIEVAPGQHFVVAERSGLSPVTKTVVAGAGEAVNVVLAFAAPVAAPTPTETPNEPVKQAEPAVKVPAARAVPPGKRQGVLELETAPPCQASVGGQSLGSTPLKGIKLPAGEVTVLCTNEALNLSATVKLTVPADGVVKRSVSFSKGKLAFDIQPWADVYLGTRKLGTTPFAPREFFEGTYTLKLVNAELGALHNLSATVKPGETTVVRFDMSAK